MKSRNLIKEIFLFLVVIAPIGYFTIIWKSLPDIVPTHFDAQGNPDNYGSKYFTAITVGLLTIGIYAFLKIIPMLDPKLNLGKSKIKYFNIRLICALFFTMIGFIIINSVKHKETSTTLIFTLIALLIAALGNYYYSLKPNYFLGFRNPWTLENESLWRKIHYMISRLWLFTGLVLAIVLFIIPIEFRLIVFITSITILIVAPFTLSLFLFLRMKRTINNNTDE